MNYEHFFSAALDRLHQERRYRVFADLERVVGRFPYAIWHSPHGKREIVMWCSNDYLAMSQHPKVTGAMMETAARMGTGAGVPETLRALIILWSNSKASWLICTIKKQL